MSEVDAVERHMRGLLHPPRSPDERTIADLAKGQHGVVARWQLLKAGFSRTAIERRVRSGRLCPIHRGIYAVGHPHLKWQGRWIAGVLACGPDALLSHRSAGALWDLLPASGARIDVTAIRAGTRSRPGIAVHRARNLHVDDLDVHDGIPVTSVARTLLDVAEIVEPWRLERAIEQAELMGLFDLRAIDSLIARSTGRRGVTLLRGVLEEYRPPPVTRSELERWFLELCRDAGLPPPAVNSFIAGFEVDIAWPDRRLVVELDGHQFHRTRAAFERDRRRDGVLQVAGYRVYRVTYRELVQDAARVIAIVRSLLASGRAA